MSTLNFFGINTKRGPKHAFALIIMMVMTPTWAAAQEQSSVREQIFSEIEKSIQEAMEQHTNLYSPKNFDQAMQFYKDAERRFERGGNLNDIRQRLTGAINYLAKADEATKLAVVAFAELTAARNASIKANASEFSKENWDKGEQTFREAAERLEDGNAKEAKKKSGEAEKFYRAAELAAIKSKFLLPAWELLEEAKRIDVKDHAPLTLQRATSLAERAEALLNQNRYDTDEALQIAQEAKYEAEHAIYLAKTIMLLKKNKDFETMLLETEAPLTRVAAELEMRPDFSKGMEGPTNRIVQSINTLVQRIRNDHTMIEQKSKEIKTLEQQVSSMQERLGSASETEKELQETLERLRREEEKMSRIAKMFTSKEAIVLRSGSNIIIRLYGLTFPVGKSTIEPQYFEILSKVKKSFDEFEKATITIEGHTDSRGSDDLNLRLSIDRASAVAQYFTAIDSRLVGRIQSEGFGESKPIASNETDEGRARNRRIDVVISPSQLVSDF